MFVDRRLIVRQDVAWLFQPTIDVGWGADHYVQWDEGDRTCVRANILGDTAADTDEWASSLGDWADDQPDASVSREGDLAVLTICG